MLSIDIETYSDIDITKSGVYAYVDSKDFKILLFAYKYNSDEIKIIDLTIDKLPGWLVQELANPDTIKTAYNANFERICLSKYLGVDLPIKGWRCTQVLALMCGLPGHLKDAAKALELDAQKDANGTRLINYFSKPCKPSKANGGRVRNLPVHNSEKWEEFKAYCMQDVRVEVAIRDKLKDYEVLESEQELYEIDQIINDRGVKVDMDLVNGVLKIDDEHVRKCRDLFMTMTNGVNPNSSSQLLGYLKGRGIEVKNTDRETINNLVSKVEDEDIRTILKLKATLSKTSIRKYNAMKRSVCSDGRIHGLLQFYGAGRTGRWAGRLVQVQNLPQNHLKSLELARDTIKLGDYDIVDLFYDDIPGTLSQLVRTAFTPEDGKKFIICDFSAIEARVIAYLAEEKWRMDVFASHGKIYEASAAQMFRVPIESITKTSPLRQKGKIAELALGYGGSIGALKAMGADSLALNEDELRGLVTRWREANKNIVRFWKEVQSRVFSALEGDYSRLPNAIGFTRNRNALYITLPSGRRLTYVKPDIGYNKFGSESMTYYGASISGAWEKQETYGGKLVENIVQAVARDCLAESIKRLHKRGYNIVFHVHDEVVIEAEKSVTVEEIENIMSEEIPWAKGLILKAAGFEGGFYRKD